jgi:arsenate reductase
MRLYHNPRCSKSRQAVAILTENGVDFEEYRYLELGIAEEDLELLSTLSGIIRTNEQDFKSERFDINDVKLVKESLKNKPKLLQRPVLINSGKAVIGRPPDDIKSLI